MKTFIFFEHSGFYGCDPLGGWWFLSADEGEAKELASQRNLTEVTYFQSEKDFYENE